MSNLQIIKAVAAHVMGWVELTDDKTAKVKDHRICFVANEQKIQLREDVARQDEAGRPVECFDWRDWNPIECSSHWLEVVEKLFKDGYDVQLQYGSLLFVEISLPNAGITEIPVKMWYHRSTQTGMTVCAAAIEAVERARSISA